MILNNYFYTMKASIHATAWATMQSHLEEMT